MSTLKYTGLTKIKVGDKIGTQKEWKEAAAAKTNLTVEQVGLAIKAAAIDGFELPADMDKNEAKIMAKVVQAARADLKAAQEMQAAENKRREDEKAAFAARKQHLATVYQEQSDSALAVANDFAGNLKGVIEGAVEDYFVIEDDGSFSLKDEDNAEEAFAAGFNRLKSLFDKSRQLGGGFALYEARLAIAAEAKLGSEWPNYFSSNEIADVRRIQRNMKAIKTFLELGKEVGEVPVGTLLALTEVKYDKENDENNSAIKAKVIDEFLTKSEEAGGYLNQKDALAIVRQATPEKQATAAQKWGYVYIFADGKVGGSNSYDDSTDAVLVIDKNQRVVIRKPDKSYEYKNIPSIGGKQAEADAKEIKDAVAAKATAAPAAKKAAKKAATKTVEKSNVVPMTIENDETPDADGETGSLDDLLA
jgi:hypothetical protein